MSVLSSLVLGVLSEPRSGLFWFGWEGWCTRRRCNSRGRGAKLCVCVKRPTTIHTPPPTPHLPGDVVPGPGGEDGGEERVHLPRVELLAVVLHPFQVLQHQCLPQPAACWFGWRNEGFISRTNLNQIKSTQTTRRAYTHRRAGGPSAQTLAPVVEAEVGGQLLVQPVVQQHQHGGVLPVVIVVGGVLVGVDSKGLGGGWGIKPPRLIVQCVRTAWGARG